MSAARAATSTSVTPAARAISSIRIGSVFPSNRTSAASVAIPSTPNTVRNACSSERRPAPNVSISVPSMSKRTSVGPMGSLPLLEPIAAVAVVVDAVLPFHLLDLPQVALRVRADAVERVKQGLLHEAAQRHSLARRKIVHERGEPLLEAEGHVHPLDLDGIAHAVDVVTEGQLVAVEILDAVVAQTVEPVSRRHHHLDTARNVKLVERVGVVDDERDGDAVRIGRA